jgi:hypothetical protein
MNAKKAHEPRQTVTEPGPTAPHPATSLADYTLDARGIHASNGVKKAGAGTSVSFANSTAADVTVSVHDARGATQDDTVLGAPFVVRPGATVSCKVLQTTTSYGSRTLKATSGPATSSLEVWHFAIDATGVFNEIDDADVPLFDPADTARSKCHFGCEARLPSSVYGWLDGARVQLFSTDPLVLTSTGNPDNAIILRPTALTTYVLTTTAAPPATPVKGHIKVKGSKGG